MWQDALGLAGPSMRLRNGKRPWCVDHGRDARRADDVPPDGHDAGGQPAQAR
jgi:hypothetical protein